MLLTRPAEQGPSRHRGHGEGEPRARRRMAGQAQALHAPCCGLLLLWQGGETGEGQRGAHGGLEGRRTEDSERGIL